MWSSPAVMENMSVLRRRGVRVIGPAEGPMAGVQEESGVGRMSEPEEIADRIEEILGADARWEGKRILVTSGPTREAIDPVRFISNRSSGMMGDAVARAARIKGAAEVYLMRGKGMAGRPPNGTITIEVDSSAELAEAVKTFFPQVDLLVMVAAVADWTVANPAPGKLKKRAGPPRLEWKETEDVLQWAGRNKTRQIVVGFALETTDHIAGAKRKLREKNADIIILNDPTRADSAFGGDSTHLTILTRDGAAVELPLRSKRQAAMNVLDAAAKFFPSS